MATIAAYPNYATVPWLKQTIVAPDFEPQTASHQYHDGGMSFNLSNTTGILMWELNYDALNSTQYGALDAHNLAAQGEFNDFSFVDRLGVTHTGVRYKEYERTHRDAHGWKAQARRVTLIKYPA